MSDNLDRLQTCHALADRLIARAERAERERDEALADIARMQETAQQTAGLIARIASALGMASMWRGSDLPAKAAELRALAAELGAPK